MRNALFKTPAPSTSLRLVPLTVPGRILVKAPHAAVTWPELSSASV